MTTIASFATFTRNKPEDKGLLNSVYILSDSKWSWANYSQPNMQKIFYSREASFVITYIGDARAGFQISSMITDHAATDPLFRRPRTMVTKIQRVHDLLDQFLNDIPAQERKLHLELFGVFSDGEELKAYSFCADKEVITFDKKERSIYEQTNIYAAGSGGKSFLESYYLAQEQYKNIPESAIYFNSFIRFLNSERDDQSSPPPQAVVISKSGVVKPVSIKIGEDFYKLGVRDDIRANYKKEIDYRDEQFEFLHADGRIKGGNRKKYHIK